MPPKKTTPSPHHSRAPRAPRAPQAPQASLEAARALTRAVKETGETYTAREIKALYTDVGLSTIKAWIGPKGAPRAPQASLEAAEALVRTGNRETGKAFTADEIKGLQSDVGLTTIRRYISDHNEGPRRLHASRASVAAAKALAGTENRETGETYTGPEIRKLYSDVSWTLIESWTLPHTGKRGVKPAAPATLAAAEALTRAVKETGETYTTDEIKDLYPDVGLSTIKAWKTQLKKLQASRDAAEALAGTANPSNPSGRETAASGSGLGDSMTPTVTGSGNYGAMSARQSSFQPSTYGAGGSSTIPPDYHQAGYDRYDRRDDFHHASSFTIPPDHQAGYGVGSAAEAFPTEIAEPPPLVFDTRSGTFGPQGGSLGSYGSPPQGSGSFNETQTQGAPWDVLGEATAQNPVVPASEWIPQDGLPRYSEGGDDLNRHGARALVDAALKAQPNVQYYEQLLSGPLAGYIIEDFNTRMSNRDILNDVALRHIAAYNTARDNTDGTSPFHQFQSQPKQPLWEEAVGSQAVGSVGGSSSYTGGFGGLRVENRPGVGWQDPNAPSGGASDFRSYETYDDSSHLQSVPAAAWTPDTGYTQPYSGRQEGPRSPTSVQWNEEEKPDQGNDPQYGAGTWQPSGVFSSMDQSAQTSTFMQSRATFFPASSAARREYEGASGYQEPTGTSGYQPQQQQTYDSSGGMALVNPIVYSREEPATYPVQGQHPRDPSAVPQSAPRAWQQLAEDRTLEGHQPGMGNNPGPYETYGGDGLYYGTSCGVDYTKAATPPRSQPTTITPATLERANVAGGYSSDSRGQKRHRSKRESIPRESITDKVAKTARGMFQGRSG
jgi:transposase